MIQRVKLYVGIVLFWSFISCSKSLREEKYINWIQDAEASLSESKSLNGFNFKLLYRPSPVIALRNLGVEANKNVLKDEIESLDEMFFFDFKISSLGNPDFLKANLKSTEEQYQRIAYFSSFAEEDFKLIANKDTLPCYVYHFERNYGIKPDQTILLGFKRVNISADMDDLKVVFTDRMLGVGKTEFTISEENIKKIPDLSI